MKDRNVNKKVNIPECSTCCGRHMSKDEIAQERRNSGWNPYWAEEEGVWSPLMENEPMLESQRLAERDLRQLQSIYPEAAKIMLPYIEETCDRMEYDGSTMYDQYPDRVTVYRLAEEIFEKVQGQFPEQCPVKKDEMLAMQYQPPVPESPGYAQRPKQSPYAEPLPYPPQPAYGYNQPGVNWVQDLARVLLLNEMHHRRRRKKNLFN